MRYQPLMLVQLNRSGSNGDRPVKRCSERPEVLAAVSPCTVFFTAGPVVW
jgi:hypothetical protein